MTSNKFKKLMKKYENFIFNKLEKDEKLKMEEIYG